MSSLRFQLQDGRTVDCPADRPAGTVFGRDPSCDVVLSDLRVSSRHLSIFAADPSGSEWFVTDLQSRHGVTINGARIAKDDPTPIRFGDLIGAGPVTLRALDPKGPAPNSSIQATLIEGPTSRVVAPAHVMLGVAELQSIARLSAARETGQLFGELLGCALSITGFGRAVVAQASDGAARSIELLAWKTRGDGARPVESVSGSLVDGALRGGMAVHDSAAGSAGASIQQSMIHNACCVLLGEVGKGPSIVLYLDSRESEPAPRACSTDIVGALASVAGACLERLGAAELEKRHASLQSELRGARAIQEKMLPPSEGTLLGGRMRYQLLSLPGRVVSGDIVDVIELGPDHAALVIGDVMGKGAPAGMLMAAIQARLSQGLRDGISLERLIRVVNEDSCERCPGMTVSLWVGVLDVSGGGSGVRVRYVDAGHGLCLCRDPEGVVSMLDRGGGPILGVAPEVPFELGEAELGPGAILFGCTDGLTEQPGPDGRMIGIEQVRMELGACPTTRSAVHAARDLLVRHSSGTLQRDDVSMLCVGEA